MKNLTKKPSKHFLTNRDFLIISALISCLAIIGLISFAYFTEGHDGLPIGWDTPLYVSQLSSISRDGLLPFIQNSDYYNFGYGLISSVFVFRRLFSIVY